ncbi:MAG: N-6 DNA methylase [Nitrosopumilaceae archaeon]|nr:N-6 DNA methylase [Nitrosopumilaceae archaeon]
MIVDILDPDTDELVIDPACGSGGFLIVVLEKIWKKIGEDGKKKKWKSERIAFKKKELASKLLFGIDKDAFLAKVTKAYMALMGDGRGGIFCENALQPVEKWNTKTQDRVQLDKFDIIVTNPPFGSKIKVEGETILSQFDLANTWKRNKTSKIWTMQEKREEKQPPQILFIERCLQLLKDGGRLGMMLPESLFANPSHGYIVEFLKKHGEITGLVSLPDELFQPYTHAKTCVLFFKKTKSIKKDYPIFMGIADYCGHDSRGNKIPFDDIPKIQQQYIKVKSKKNIKHNSIGFTKKSNDLKNNIVIPKYYNPTIIAELNKMKKTHNLVSIKELVENNTLALSTGVEIGKMSYGTGEIPFIRTSDISNWEIKIDPKHGVNEDIYNEYVTKCDLQENDILLVRDGTYLIGTCALITKNDLKSLFQSHIYKIRVLNKKKLSPFLLLALFASPIVQRQIRAKQFTQDIIDTLGSRLNELILPIPKDSEFTKIMTAQTKSIIQKRTQLRKIASEIPIKIQKGKE